MPLHLSALSRRRFLIQTGAGVAGVLLAQETFSSTTQGNPDSWALLSDPHIAADRTFAGKDGNVASHLEQAVADVLALADKPAGAFVNGDCAYGTGQPGDYRLFTEILAPVRQAGIPLHLVLGNHDDRQNFLAGVALANPGERQPVQNKFVGLIRSKHANWYLLDSLERTASTPGLLGQEQLQWLAGTLDANSRQPAIVMLHHNPGISGNMGLKDTVELFEVIRFRQHVKALIYGHTHLWTLERDTSGLHLVNLPALGYAFKAGEPTGWVHALLEPGGMTLQLSTTDRRHKAHGEVAHLQWR